MSDRSERNGMRFLNIFPWLVLTQNITCFGIYELLTLVIFRFFWSFLKLYTIFLHMQEVFEVYKFLFLYVVCTCTRMCLDQMNQHNRSYVKNKMKLSKRKWNTWSHVKYGKMLEFWIFRFFGCLDFFVFLNIEYNCLYV